MNKCSQCLGTGKWVNHGMMRVTCNLCGGTGIVPDAGAVTLTDAIAAKAEAEPVSAVLSSPMSDEKRKAHSDKLKAAWARRKAKLDDNKAK